MRFFFFAATCRSASFSFNAPASVLAGPWDGLAGGHFVLAVQASGARQIDQRTCTTFGFDLACLRVVLFYTISVARVTVGDAGTCCRRVSHRLRARLRRRRPEDGAGRGWARLRQWKAGRESRTRRGCCRCVPRPRPVPIGSRVVTLHDAASAPRRRGSRAEGPVVRFPTVDAGVRISGRKWRLTPALSLNTGTAEILSPRRSSRESCLRRVHDAGFE